MSSETAVYLDCDGTLLAFTRPYGEIIGEAIEAELGTAPDDLVEAYDGAFFEAFVGVEPEPVLRGMEAVREAAVAGDHGDPDPEALRGALLDAERAATEPSPGTVDLLTGLSATHVGALTNGVPDWQRAKLDHHGLLDHLDAVVTSYEAGAHKPDPAMYDLARERAPDSVERFVMVGDDHEPDVEGARDAGFEAVHLDRERDAPAVPSLAALAGLRSL